VYRLLTKTDEVTVVLDWDKAITKYLHTPWIVEIQRKTEDGWERISRDD
jgi:hypothetical protein